ncbi:MAG: ROK family protein [Chloroflexi bacterium]|nr:ROK family protein [Chloroflexota bacterium]
MRHAIGIDIGGTKLKGGLVEETGRVVFKESRSSPAGSQTPGPIVDALIGFANDLRERALGLGLESEGFGFGPPNFFEGPDWIQRQVNNMPGLEGFALRPPLAAALGENIAMDNDVMNGGLAEYYFGEGHNYDRVFFIAIGTGIAASIFIEGGQRIRYHYGWPGDTGHIIIDPHGRPCTCGGRGCLETVATIRPIRDFALAAARSKKSPALAARLAGKGDLEPRDVTEAALAGDVAAKEIWDEVGGYLGMALTSYVHIFAPHVILVGGGIAEAGELLLEPARRALAALGSPYYLGLLRGVKKASLGPDAGLIGAAALMLLPESLR